MWEEAIAIQTIYAADLDYRGYITGMVFIAGGNPVSRKSSLQMVVSLSTTGDEYIALSEAVMEGVWLKIFSKELGFPQESVETYCDFQGAVALSKNTFHHERTKPLTVKYHFARDLINVGKVQVLKIATTNNPTYIFTKVLPLFKLGEALRIIRVTQN